MKATGTLQSAEPAEPNPAAGSDGSSVVDQAESDPSTINRYLARHRDASSTGAALLIFIAMVIYGQVTYGAILQPSTISNPSSPLKPVRSTVASTPPTFTGAGSNRK